VLKKSNWLPRPQLAPQLAITKQCCGRVLGNEMALGTLYRKFLVGAEDLENIEINKKIQYTLSASQKKELLGRI